MRAIVSIVVVAALGVAATAHTASGKAGPAARYAQADKVSVIKVEGMT